MNERQPGSPALPPELETLVREVLDASGLELPVRVDVEADLRAHFEDGLSAGVAADELRARFGDPSEAGHRIARSRRGAGPGRYVEKGGWWMSGSEWWMEARRAVRRLGRSPGFALLVILTLAVGVGANTAVFSVVDAVLLRPLPYREPERLVRIYQAPTDRPDDTNYLSGPEAAVMRTWDQVFERVGVLNTYRASGADLTTGDHAERVSVVHVAAGYFETLGVAPELGRTFTEAETQGESPATPGAQGGVAVVSHELWQRFLGGSRDAVGRTLPLDGRAYEVVGVMPAAFQDPFGAQGDVWTPVDLSPGESNRWGNNYLSAVARLRPGLTPEGAQERARALFAGLRAADPGIPDRWLPRVVALRDDIVGASRRTMVWILAAAAALVLLTACVNLANLLFARGLGRDRDVAVRAVLGSGRARIVASLLLETAILAILGGAAGMALGWAGVRGLLALAPDALPRVMDVGARWPVFVFAFGTTVVALVVAGLTPALRLSTTVPVEALRADGRTTTGGRRARRARDTLAILQVAAALVLVVGAALLVRSFARLATVPLNIEAHDVLTFEVNLPRARYPDGASREAFHRLFNEQVSALAEVESTGAVSWLPLRGHYNEWGVYWSPEHPDGSDDNAYPSSDVRIFSGDYFASLGMSLVLGEAPRDIDLDTDTVVWVNQSWVTSLFGERNPLDQRIGIGGPTRRVAGVVADVPVNAEGEVPRTLYVPHAQYADNRNWPLTQTVRVHGRPADAQARIAAVLAAIDPDLVLYQPRPLGEVVAVARAPSRFSTVLMGAFALLALGLALMGTYGVLAGSVAGRGREFGIRMALGANPGSVRGTVLAYAARLVAPGVALGLGGAWIAAGWLQGLLFQVEPRDPWVLGGAGVLFVAVGLMAAWAPARRATRVDPARALSAE